MASHTEIQWADTTVNPVAGYNGCELYPTTPRLVREIDNFLRTYTSANGLSDDLRNQLVKLTPTQFRQERKEWARRISAAADSGDPDFKNLAPEIERTIMAQFRCYAGTLTALFNPNGTHPGYPRTFEEPRMFPGRMAEAAKLPPLMSMERPAKPWLDGLPRIQFISDMGDALSREISFEYLRQEIVDVVSSVSGRFHIWIWLTKRPSRMAEFGEWLVAQGIPWPDNLVAGTSVTDKLTTVRLQFLRKVPARFRMVSFEPLLEEIDPDLRGIHWAIAGGESGHHARPFELMWLETIRQACQPSRTAFFVKQLGARPSLLQEGLCLKDTHGGDWNEWPANFRYRELPYAWYYAESWPLK